jgi:hypothetical protein
MMLEIALQRLIDDLVVPVVLALIPKRAFPCVAILQFGERNDLRRALRERNSINVAHGKKRTLNRSRRKEDSAIRRA